MYLGNDTTWELGARCRGIALMLFRFRDKSKSSMHIEGGGLHAPAGLLGKIV